MQRKTAETTGQLVGLIGCGILASKSPILHQSEADAQGLRLIYALYDFDREGWGDDALAALVPALKLCGFRGVNVTFPFKQAVIPLLDELSPEAAAIGAVNTVVFRDGRSIGYNTDVTGFAQGLRDQVPQERLDRVVQLGAGGAGSAAAQAMLEMGVGHLTIVEPDASRRSSLVDGLRSRFGPDRVTGADAAYPAIEAASGLVNATPVGMAKLPGTPIDTALLGHCPWVYEIIYVPTETQLLKAAQAHGCLTINGVTMVIHQAAAAFRLFTGLDANTERMRDAFRA